MSIRGKQVERTCKTCKVKFMAREADVKRGWAKFCSKSCKAVKQERRTHQYANYIKNTGEREYYSQFGDDPLFDGNGEYIGQNGHPFHNDGSMGDAQDIGDD